MTKYLIAHIGHTCNHHEHITWWNPDSKGYTVCIDKAGLYDEEEARSICKYGQCIAVTKEVAQPLARTTPYYRRSDGTLNKLYDGGPHSVVPNTSQDWRVLMSSRLNGCGKADKPTPISQAKAQAIYLTPEALAA